MIFFFTACENEEIISPDSTYNEVLVVQSELKGNTQFPGVRLTKSLPLNVQFTIEKAEVTDAILYLKINGTKIIPLQYISEGMYNPLYNFSVREGEIYELFGQRGDQTFYAKTTIPFTPDINSVSYNYSGQYAEATVNPVSDQVYGALWVISGAEYIYADNFFNISVPDINLNSGNLIVRSSSYPDKFQTSAYNGRRYIQVFSFDSAFNDYFRTSGTGETVNNPYVKGSGNTIWNVKGKKVIGMFIGYSNTPLIFIN